MSWFEAKDHCESRGGKVFSLKIEIFFKRWKVGGNRLGRGEQSFGQRDKEERILEGVGELLDRIE